MNTPARYSARWSVTAVDLVDNGAKVEVRILPSLGNRACAMKIRRANILWNPPGALESGKTDPGLNGIPFLAPWANRLTGGFRANGSWQTLEGADVPRDAGGLPIHGLLSASKLWEVVNVCADSESASVTSRLNFGAHPELLALWPWRHEYEMTWRLSEGALTCRTTVRNTCTEPMPLSVGFHPYFVMPGMEHADLSVRIPARRHIETDERLVATGELTPNTLSEWVDLKTHALDDGFTDLIHGPDGGTRFSIACGGRSIHVDFGEKYRVAIVYPPPAERYVCVEPMTALTNGINLSAEGKYGDLQTVEPGGEWSESFVVSTEGFA